MTSQNPPTEGEREARSPTERILLIVGDRTDRSLLIQAFTDRYDVVTPENTELPNEDIDLVIVDAGGLNAFKDELGTRKGSASPIFLPYLLLVPQNHADSLPGNVWDHVDGVARLPISKEELAARVEGLLQARQLSLTAHRKTERLDNVASVIAHDLRNPLNIITGYIEQAQATDDLTALEPAATAADHAVDLIENVLAVARRGHESLTMTAVDVESVANDAWEQVESPSAALHVESTDILRADRTHLRELFENLFRNAVDHAGEEVTVRVGMLDDPDHSGIYIADDGMGLPDRDDLFEMGVTTAEEGTGFGLAIVGEIASLHSWAIHAMESQNGGARFEITGIEMGSE